MTETKWITIYFTDGTDLSFRYPEQQIADHLLQSTLDRVLSQQVLILEGEGAAYMFPYSNIKYIKLQPVGETLPEGTIRGVQILR